MDSLPSALPSMPRFRTGEKTVLMTISARMIVRIHAPLMMEMGRCSGTAGSGKYKAVMARKTRYIMPV